MLADANYPDALSYDFSPLQGITPLGTGKITANPNFATPHNYKLPARAARISTLEIAIRTQAKRFLAHPLVVQHLEAIWAGSIVFHSAADNLHRPLAKPLTKQTRNYGATVTSMPLLRASPDKLQPLEQRDYQELVTGTIRRSVTLYDPRDASFFKLSRLRVPRYRQFLSTCSLAVLLGLFLAVLAQRSLEITSLEVVFWFWSAGFMLDEIVGFNVQGFSLYIMRLWDAFDLGILLLLVCYYCMRLYGILMAGARKHHVASMAYDVLAANAVLLFPRLFSVLDHYRYFSQLLIAFRMMAVDLVAVLILIVISCSGFFVAFTLSFGDDGFDAGSVAYALFQMIMGFTPAAWESWGKYNLLGKSILTLFLFITHFLVVTILITVLTNSFMAIVQNANEEHQFVFAVNTISMVKSDALFSYIAPTNIVAWLLTPMRYFLPFRQFVRINRSVIKATHFPVLIMIYAYERMILRSATFEATELIEQRGRLTAKVVAFNSPGAGLNMFSPRRARLREPSVATSQKDRALEEVFRRPFKGSTLRDTHKRSERRKTSNVVDSWMRNLGPDGTASSPVEQDRSIVESLEARRPKGRTSQLPSRRMGGNARNFTEATRSIASDPEDFGGKEFLRQPYHYRQDSDLPSMGLEDLPEQTDGDGDDELVTNDEEEKLTLGRKTTHTGNLSGGEFDNENRRGDYFKRTSNANPSLPLISPSVSLARSAKVGSASQEQAAGANPPQPTPHTRNDSSNTILYNPMPYTAESRSSPSRNATTAKNSGRNTGTGSSTLTHASAGTRTPKRQVPGPARARPIMPPRSAFQSAPDLAGMLMLERRPLYQRRISLDMDLGSDIGDNKAMGGGFVGAVPSSFATQMAMATDAMRSKANPAISGEDQRMMSRLMLARMNTLEEGFREVLKEVKDWRREGGTAHHDERILAKGRAKGHVKKKEHVTSGKQRFKVNEEKDWVDEDEISRGDKRTSI